MSANTLQAKIEQIRKTGVPYTAIARRAQIDISTLFRIRQGVIEDPKYSVGSAIDRMHAELFQSAPPAA